MIDKSIQDAETEKLKELFAAKKSLEKEQGRDFTQGMIAAIGGWTQPNVSAYLRGSVQLKEESALVFSKAFGVPISVFSPRIADRISKREMLAKNPLLNETQVTFVPKVTAKMLDQIRSNLNDPSFIMPMSEETTPVCKSLSNTAFSYDLQDNSLSPKYTIGSSFVFDPFIEPKPTNLVLVANKSKPSDYHIRQYQVSEILEDGREIYELVAFNPAFPTLKDNYEILGVAVAAVEML